MPSLPNPWLAEVHPRSAEESATATTHGPRDAVAEPFESAPSNPCGPTTAAAGVSPEVSPVAASLAEPNFIGEIFHHARRLMDQHNRVHRRFVLDEEKFMEAIEPMPLFLQRLRA